MGEKFMRFKRRANTFRLVRALLLGAGAGTLASGVLNLLVRLEVISLKPVLLVLIGLGAALVVGVPVFLFVRLSDGQLARALDKELSLDERIETMHEYRGEESAMHLLQREDAEGVLEALSVKSLKFKRLWLYITVFALGAAMLATSFAFSKPEDPPPPETPPELFELTEHQSKAIEALIAEIEASDMESEAKATTLELIRSLHEVLKVTDTVEAKNAAVALTMKGILEAIDTSSSAVEIITALWSTDQESLMKLAKAINYYDWPKIDEWNRFEKDMQTFRDTLSYTPDPEIPSDEALELTLTEMGLIFTNSSNGIRGVLSGLKVPETDSLGNALKRLATANEEFSDGTRIYGFEKLNEVLAASGYDAAMNETDATVTALSTVLYAALIENKDTTSTGEGAVERLGAILGCSIPRFERPSFRDSEESGGEGDEDDEVGGGAISGGTEYGSDDLVLDPYTNTYVQYGVLLDRYYALVIGSIENGKHTENEREALMKYFSILYGGFDEGE